MVNYGSLTELETYLMAAIVIATNAFGVIPVIALFKRRNLEFEALIALMAVFSSTMYHLCEVLHCELYLEELKWHRLDNVFVITGIAIFVYHLTGSGHARKSMYFAFVISILTQEKDPWNINWTILPLIIYTITAIVLKCIYRNKYMVEYDMKKLGISLGVLVFGSYFYIKGLNEYEDYLRFNHGVWHLLASIANYYGMKCNTCKPIIINPLAGMQMQEEEMSKLL